MTSTHTSTADDDGELPVWIAEITAHHARVGEIDIDLVRQLTSAGKKPVQVIRMLTSYYAAHANHLGALLNRIAGRGHDPFSDFS